MKDPTKQQYIRPELGKGFRISGWILRTLFGAVFVFSGFVKAIDPLGSAYKITDYLTALNLQQLDVLALPIAITLSAVEMGIGISLVTSIQAKFSSVLAIVFMLIMTPFTLWIALTNPVSDCGCFGDAIVLSNWTTFWKNIVLLILIIAVIYLNNYYRPYLSPMPSWLLFATFFMIPLALSCYSLRHLPLIDFRPYKVGNHLEDLMQVPQDAPTDQYKTTFIYEKNGIQQEFDETNYPWNDSTWTFISQNSVLVKKGYTPPIHDFNLITLNGDDVTDIVLAADKVYIVVMYDLRQTDTLQIDKINALYKQAQKEGTLFYALTADLETDIQDFKEVHGCTFPFCQVDPITLKTIIRANPGIVLLQKGTVTHKWNAKDFIIK